MFHFHPCKLFFLILPVVGLSVASRFPKWQMVPWWGKTPVSWEGHEPEEKQALSQKGLPGKVSRWVCQGSGSTPIYSLPRGLFPWWGEGRGELSWVSDVSDILMRGWLCSVLARRMCFIGAFSTDASTSSKQSVQKMGRGLHVLAALKGVLEGGLLNEIGGISKAFLLAENQEVPSQHLQY